MKSNAIGVLTAHLNAQGFLFNGYRDRDLSNFIEPFQELIQTMPLQSVSARKVYRARSVNLKNDVNVGKGIIEVDGNLSGGFNEENSRIAPSECCKIQRLNREGEQVFYIAEERNIAIAEQKAVSNVYLSVAEFDIIHPIHILDFSAYTHEEQHCVITDEMEKDFQERTNYSARQLYYEIQRFFTILESGEDFYNVSNKVCDLIKADNRVDGIRYSSYYKGHNLGIWKYRSEDYAFIESKIEKIM